MVIGGVAVIACGVKRMTTDLDVVVEGGTLALEPLLARLARAAIVPRIKDAAAFARANLVLLLRHRPTGVDLDISFGWTEFEHKALSAGASTPFGAVRAPMARPQDLVIFKVIAARPKDIEDATALLLMHATIDREEVRRSVAELAALAEDPSLLAVLDAILERVGSYATKAVKTSSTSAVRVPRVKAAKVKPKRRPPKRTQ